MAPEKLWIKYPDEVEAFDIPCQGSFERALQECPHGLWRASLSLSATEAPCADRWLSPERVHSYLQRQGYFPGSCSMIRLRAGRRGDRISSGCEKVRELGFASIVASHFAYEVSEDGEVLRSVAEAVSGLVLVHIDVELPMQGVFDIPAAEYDVEKTLGREGRAKRIEGCFGRRGGLVAAFGFALAPYRGYGA